MLLKDMLAILAGSTLVVAATGSVGGEVGRMGLDAGVGPGSSPAVATSPPAGLLDFCSRRPSECEAPGHDVTRLRSDIAKASRQYWQDVFAGRVVRSEGPAAVSRSQPPNRVPDPNSGIDLGGLGARATMRLERGSLAWEEVAATNRRLNREIHQMLDQRQYGRSDHWEIPLGDKGRAARGDCEDFVLAKRSALIAAGIPAGILSIALAQTSDGQDHAVLLISTKDGDYVLDNLTGRIDHWTRTGLRWQSRNHPGELLNWVDLRGH